MPPNESMGLAWSRTAYRSRPLRTFKEIRWLSSEADMSRAVATNQLARGSNDPDIVPLNGALSDVATFRYMRPSERESAGAPLRCTSQNLAVADGLRIESPNCPNWSLLADTSGRPARSSALVPETGATIRLAATAARSGKLSASSERQGDAKRAACPNQVRRRDQMVRRRRSASSRSRTSMLSRMPDRFGFRSSARLA